MTREQWLTVVDPPASGILADWKDAEKEAEVWLEEAGEEIEDLKGTVEDLREKISKGPEWGNCRRGCPPAYLNIQGYCSPECELGIEHYRRQNQE